MVATLTAIEGRMLKKDEDATVETAPSPNRYLGLYPSLYPSLYPNRNPTLSLPHSGRDHALAHVDGGEREGRDRRAHR